MQLSLSYQVTTGEPVYFMLDDSGAPGVSTNQHQLTLLPRDTQRSSSYRVQRSAKWASSQCGNKYVEAGKIQSYRDLFVKYVTFNYLLL